MKNLLAIDFSPEGQDAVREVSLRPWPAGTTFEVLTVLDSPHLWALGEVIEEINQRADGLVQQAAQTLRSTGLACTSLVLTGDPKAIIVDHATAMGADLVVVGSHGAGRTPFLIGSVARAVVRYGPCPVEIIRSTGVRSTQSGLRILLATDGSQDSINAARSIALRPWPKGTEVQILCAVELQLSAYETSFSPLFVSEVAQEQARAAAMKRAEDAVAEAERILSLSRDLSWSESISVLLEKPERIILDEANQWRADLIVLGSHGHRGLNRFLLGSVSEAVALHAPCSVEVIR